MAGKGPDVSESVFERDDYEHTDDGIGSPEDELPDSPSDQMLEQGYSPPERSRGLDAFGTTLTEERAGESLDRRLAQEEPDPAGDVDPDQGVADPDFGPGDVPAGREWDEGAWAGDDDEVGDARAGRLFQPGDGMGPNLDGDLVASDVGIDGAGASAEEAALHVVGLAEADAALDRDDR